MDRQSRPEEPNGDLRVNFLRPRRGFMRREVTIIWVTLTAWAVLTFGFPLYRPSARRRNCPNGRFSACRCTTGSAASS
jgi:hypothetical protein